MNAQTFQPARSHLDGNEWNALEDPDAYYAVERPTVDLRSPDLAKVTRLRMLGEYAYPYWDISYAHGELHDGTPVTVNMPVDRFRRYSNKSLKGQILDMCKEARVFGKGLGLLDDATYSFVS